MTIFDSAQFSKVKPFSYIFFWGGLLAVLYPPYIQIAKWKWIGNLVNSRVDKNFDESSSSKDSSHAKKPQTAPATPINQNKPGVLQATATKAGELNEEQLKAQQTAFAEAEKNRKESKQYLKKTPTLKSHPLKNKFNLLPEKTTELTQTTDPAKPKTQNPTEEGPMNCSSFYYKDEYDTREQMYNNVWRHFRSDYRRMNPITKHDGVVEFWRMIKSSLC